MTNYFLQQTKFGTENKTPFLSVFETASGVAVIDVWTIPKAPIFMESHAVTGSPVEHMRIVATASAPIRLGPPVSLAALELRSRLKARWPAIIARAQKLEEHIPDPVQAIVDLLGSLPGNYDTWREILEEPYG